MNAKIAGIGGINVSVRDNDPYMFFSNPALLNESMLHYGGVSYHSYFADIWNSSVCYTFNTKKAGLFGAGLQYVNYGSATSTDPSGNVIGTVSANDYAFTVSKSHTIDNYTLGANVKFIGSQIAGYSAYGLFADLGGVFKHPKRDFTIGLTIKNIGAPVKNYVPGNAIAIPFDVQAGFTYKLEHMPLRFSLTVHHLHRYDISYDDPNYIRNYDIYGNPVRNKVSVAENILRHFNFGGEFILAKGFHIRAGYNHFRRAELKTEDYGGLAGFSFGAMLKIKAVELGFTRAFYHAVGGNNYFTLLVNFGNWIKKAEKPSSEENPSGS